MNSFSSSKPQNQQTSFTLNHQPSPQPSNRNSKLFESTSLGYLEDMRRQLFQESAANLMSLYKESIKRCEESYLQGKEDAYEEVLKWFMGFNNGDFKHVSTYEFFNFISSKLQEQRSTKKKQPNISGLTPTTSASSNFIATGGSTSGQNQGLLASNNNQPSNRQSIGNSYVSNNRLTSSNGSQSNSQLQNASEMSGVNLANNISLSFANINIPTNQQILTSSKDNYIDMLAMVTELEAQNERLSIVPKINFKLNEIKVQDSKKRRRPNSQYQEFQHILSKNQCNNLNQGQSITEHQMEDDALAKEFYNQVRFKPSFNQNESGNELNFFYLNQNNSSSSSVHNDQLTIFHQYQQSNEQQQQQHQTSGDINNYNFNLNAQ